MADAKDALNAATGEKPADEDVESDRTAQIAGERDGLLSNRSA